LTIAGALDVALGLKTAEARKILQRDAARVGFGFGR
jgi:hypothetical protein